MESVTPDAGAAVLVAGRAVDDRSLHSPSVIRAAVPVARAAGLAVSSRSHTRGRYNGFFTGLSVAPFQNWLYERNREWQFTDGTLCVLWCVEFPEAIEYANRLDYVASTRTAYNAGRHGAPAPSTPCVAYKTHGHSPRRLGLGAAKTRESATPSVATSPPPSTGAATDQGPLLGRLTTSPESTARRLAALQSYMNAEVLSSSGFVCHSHGECRASHDGNFFEGQLHHLGRYYDVAIDGRPFRVAVVGQEYGNGPARVDLCQRYEDVAVNTGLRKAYVRNGSLPGRNPHMRGTTSLLRLLFGLELGIRHDEEFIETNSGRVHVFDLFALTNFLLCSAVEADSSPTGSKHGRSTRTMQRNCARHFVRTMEILEPSVIVVQGAEVRQWMRPFTSASPPDEIVTRLRVGLHETWALFLSHPSAPSACWADLNRRYLLETVVPALRTLRSILA